MPLLLRDRWQGGATDLFSATGVEGGLPSATGVEGGMPLTFALKKSRSEVHLGSIFTRFAMSNKHAGCLERRSLLSSMGVGVLSTFSAGP